MIKKKKVSIDEIAKIAGVSRGTVSRAFNQRADINKKTRERVLEAARKLNYFPNSAARGLAKGRTECIGVVVPDLKNPYLPEMVTAIERHARQAGLSALLAITGGDIRAQEDILLRMASGQVDGILITPCECPDSVAMLNQINQRLPVISLKFFDGLECDSVMSNDKMAVRMIVEHLVELGHKRIAFIGPSDVEWSLNQRLQAFQECKSTYNLDFDLNYLMPMAEVDDDDVLRRTMRKTMNLAPQRRPTAIFAFDDIIALRTIRELQLLGHAVPQDISVAGFDDIRLSTMASVPLTTVSASSDRLGEAAIGILQERLKDEPLKELRHITLIPELAVRQSTAPPKP